LNDIELWQDSPKDRANFIIAKVVGNLPIPHVLDHVSNIPKWNARVENYVISMFDFVNKYLVRNESILLFYDDDFCVLRNIKSYLEDYNFKVHSKFIVVNSLHRTSPEFPSKKVNLFANSTEASKFWASSLLTFFLYYLSQTLLISRAIMLVPKNGSFVFSMDP
jgi:hypothetical protein